ncbi:MAG: hypothetical protein HY319_31095 [Armatimonadetes bacterium]|nr:hypothetical protein [Armatimonadota bacterium]
MGEHLVNLHRMFPDHKTHQNILAGVGEDHGIAAAYKRGVSLDPCYATRLFASEETCRDYFLILYQTLQRDLDEKGWGACGNHLEDYVDKLFGLTECGAVPPERLWRPPLKESFEALLEGLTRSVREAVDSDLSEQETRSLLFARCPRLHKVLCRGLVEHPVETVRRDLFKLAADPAVRRAFGGTLDLVRLGCVMMRDYPDAELYDLFLQIDPLVDYRAGGYAGQERGSVDGIPRTFDRLELQVDLALDYAEWLRQNHPDRVDIRRQLLRPYLSEEACDHWFTTKPETFIGHPGDPVRNRRAARVYEKVFEAWEGFYRERWRHHLECFSHLPPRQRGEKVAEAFLEETPVIGGNTGARFDHILIGELPEEINERLEFLLGYSQGARRWARAHPEAFHYQGDRDRMLKDPSYAPEEGRMNLKSWVFDEVKSMGQMPQSNDWEPPPGIDHLKDEAALSRVRPETLIEFLYLMIRLENWDRVDFIFEHLWKVTEDRPELRQKLAREELVGSLTYDRNRIMLARWQLNQAFDLEGSWRRLKKPSAHLPYRKQCREVVKKAARTVDRQFPQACSAKNEVLSYIENRLVTNERETQRLERGKITLDNWYRQRGLAALDLPQGLNSMLDSNYDRLELMKFIVGLSDEKPRFMVRRENEGKRHIDWYFDGLKAVRRNFTTSNIHVRTFLLQPLLDSEHGILGDPRCVEELTDLILGKYRQEPVARALFQSYLDSVPETERKVILGRIMAAFAERSGDGASIKRVLEAMGPFGIKAGQFMRSGGLVSGELRGELDEFFDNALPPGRAEILGRIKEAFGPRLRSVLNVRQLVGSGSINYIVLADLLEPGTGQKRTVVVRVRRQAVEGRVANEDAIWTRAIGRLACNPNPNISRLASLLDEARTHTMATLAPGGAELDLELERRHAPLARKAYASGPDPGTGYRIEVIKPLSTLQELIPDDLSQAISIYEYVPNSSLSDLEPNLRGKLAAQIVGAELSALAGGVFDPDGHPGNWLIDTEQHRLVRIDYAQLKVLPQGERQSFPEAFRKSLGALLWPRPDARVVAEQFGHLFEASGETPDLEEAITTVLGRWDLPSYRNVHERFFFLREKLEDYYQQRGGPEQQVRLRDTTRAALGSLCRTLNYREHTGQEPYLRMLLDFARVDFESYVATVRPREIWQRVKEAAGGFFAA